ncbi:hypothetical protein PG997_008666 [Apiospora hydei]|uniref:Cytochrome P450 n=1 Tax=Apiospora hydei TaxID=1337664 RepID=A0ABR1WBG7_9PEZI
MFSRDLMQSLFTDPLQWHFFVLVSAWLLYQLAQAAWNLSPFHPLSSIPGPRLAGATYLPEFYYDAVKFGTYTKRIQRLHEAYGPIVRISPNEVHCNDPAFSDEIYASAGRRRDKPLHQIRGSGAVSGAIFSTAGHELHRVRRNAFAKFFSRAQVAKLEGKVQRLVQTLCDKMMSAGGQPFDVTEAYSCLSTDVVSDYAFGESFGFLDQEAWKPNFRGPACSINRPVFLFRFFPASRYLSTLALGSMSRKGFKEPRPISMRVSGEKTRPCSAHFWSQISPEQEKSIHRLTDEAAALLTAGSETVSWALTVITYHLLDKPDILRRLCRELERALDPSGGLPSWSSLEKLPYLGAAISEGLRLSYGLSSRTARIATHEDLIYRGVWRGEPCQYIIPRGYAVGMSAALLHHDEDLFPDSHAFRPERWLLSGDGSIRNKELERHLLTFSKGSRSCVGINLAYCELHVGLAALCLRVLPNMRLYKTTEEDIKYDHDMFNPMPKRSSKGVRVAMRS